MKKLLASLILVSLLAGCETSTRYGECVGIGTDSEDPALKYEWSTLNLILGVVFVETVIVPIVVVTKEAKCPVGKK